MWKISSAGTWTKSGSRVDPLSFKIAQLAGVDLSSHLTTSIEDAHPAEYDWIAVMDAGHLEALTIEFPELQEKIHLLSSLAGLTPYEIKDPLKHDFDMAMEIVLDMQDCVRRFYRQLMRGGNY